MLTPWPGIASLIFQTPTKINPRDVKPKPEQAKVKATMRNRTSVRSSLVSLSQRPITGGEQSKGTRPNSKGRRGHGRRLPKGPSVPGSSQRAAQQKSPPPQIVRLHMCCAFGGHFARPPRDLQHDHPTHRLPSLHSSWSSMAVVAAQGHAAESVSLTIQMPASEHWTVKLGDARRAPAQWIVRSVPALTPPRETAKAAPMWRGGQSRQHRRCNWVHAPSKHSTASMRIAPPPATPPPPATADALAPARPAVLAFRVLAHVATEWPSAHVASMRVPCGTWPLEAEAPRGAGLATATANSAAATKSLHSW
mmetsp:Transcript_522/g.1226  ORF Transcript_522/g.1226 Transcript_522/m.1226 type:complete len:308 (+) Transcript_522:927-1850(+)